MDGVEKPHKNKPLNHKTHQPLMRMEQKKNGDEVEEKSEVELMSGREER